MGGAVDLRLFSRSSGRETCGSRKGEDARIGGGCKRASSCEALRNRLRLCQHSNLCLGRCFLTQFVWDNFYDEGVQDGSCICRSDLI